MVEVVSLKRASHRQSRLNKELFRFLSAALVQNDLPPVMDNGVALSASPLTTVTQVDVAPDMKSAIIYYSHIENEHEKTKRYFKLAAPKIRTLMAKTLNMRHTPQLKFLPDKDLQKQIRIDVLLQQVQKDFDEVIPST